MAILIYIMLLVDLNTPGRRVTLDQEAFVSVQCYYVHAVSIYL